MVRSCACGASREPAHSTATLPQPIRSKRPLIAGRFSNVEPKKSFTWGNAPYAMDMLVLQRLSTLSTILLLRECSLPVLTTSSTVSSSLTKCRLSADHVEFCLRALSCKMLLTYKESAKKRTHLFTVSSSVFSFRYGLFWFADTATDLHWTQSRPGRLSRHLDPEQL